MVERRFRVTEHEGPVGLYTGRLSVISAHAKKCPVCLNMTGHMTERCFVMSSPVNRPNPDCRCLSGVQPPEVFPQRPDHSDHFLVHCLSSTTLVLACRAEKDAASSCLAADGH